MFLHVYDGTGMVQSVTKLSSTDRVEISSFRAFEVNSRHKQTSYFHLPRV